MSRPASSLTRRRLLGLGLSAAGAAALDSVPAALALAAAGPSAASVVVPLPGGRRVGPVAVPGGLELAGVRWRGHAEPAVHLRARRRGGRWGPWTALHHAHDHGPDRGGAVHGTDPVWTGPADEVELRLSRPVHGLALHAVRTHGARRTPRAGAAQVEPGAPPPIVLRSEWGGDRLRTRGHVQYGDVQLAFVHHTVNANDYGPADSAAIVLAIARYHIDTNRWNDIGYNFLVDRFGQIFEGRAGGIDQAVVGAQAQGFNSWSTGVANLGTFETVGVTDAAMASLSKLIAWKLALHGVPVLGDVTVESLGGPTNRYKRGTPVTLQRISGHRDGDKTSCPGDALYAQLPELRRRAAGEPYQPQTQPSEPEPQPETDGETPSDQLTLAAATTEVAADSDLFVTGELRDASGYPLPAAPISVQRRGRGRWRTVAEVETDASGQFTGRVQVPSSSQLRAVYPGDAMTGIGPLYSSSVAVTARAELALRSSRARVRAGRAVRLEATLRPSRRRVTVVVDRRRRGRWVRVATMPMSVAGTTASSAVRLDRAGVYRLTARAPADGRAGAASAQVLVRATRGRPGRTGPVSTQTPPRPTSPAVTQTPPGVPAPGGSAVAR